VTSTTLAERVLEITDTVVLVLDRDGGIRYVNPACEELTGYTADELRGREVFEVLIPEDDREEVRTYWKELWEEEAGARHRNPWVTKTGERCYLTWSNAVVRAEDGQRYVVATGTDITRRRELERDVVQVSESERQRIGQELHDTLASDLVAAAMKMDNLQGRLERADLSNIRSRLESIEKSIREASKQARSLSHLLAAGEMTPDELPGALSELVQTYRDSSGVACRLSLPDADLPALLNAAEARHLYRIAQEAVRNAVHHGAPDHLAVQVEVLADFGESVEPKGKATGTPEQAVVLRVRDDGMGIPDEIATDLQPAAEAPPEREERGMSDGMDDGIGLHLMTYRADLIGADLSIGAGDGGGTVVRCELPVR
jgi:two-component system CheB/CheR fusion protein